MPSSGVDNIAFVTTEGLVLTVVMGILLVILPRRYAFLPIIVMTCYMTLGQRILVFDLDFTLLRIITLFGILRLIIRLEFRGLRLNELDKMILWWVLVNSIAYVLLWQSTDAIINRLGFAYNAIGMYFLCRVFLTNTRDMVRIVRIMAILMVPLAACIVYEKMTRYNVFSILGGVASFTAMRDGVLRCQGPFAHPILTGTFGATHLTMFIALWFFRGFSRVLSLIGVTSASAIIYCSGSSGPVMAAVFGVLALWLWRWRFQMQPIRRTILFTLIFLHMTMKAPVWFLLGRVSVFSGSTGWHRAHLIDRAVAHFGEWWLVGTKDTGAWGLNLQDVTNQYIVVGTDGGFLSMVLFILIIARAFRSVGLIHRAIPEKQHVEAYFVWSLGAALMAHAASYISVSYFDQNYVVWYALLAAISGIRQTILDAPEAKRVGQEATLGAGRLAVAEGGGYGALRRFKGGVGMANSKAPRSQVPS